MLALYGVFLSGTHTMNRLWKSDRKRSWEVVSSRERPPQGFENSYIDKLLFLLVIRPSSLVFKDHVIIPSTRMSVQALKKSRSRNSPPSFDIEINGI